VSWLTDRFQQMDDNDAQYGYDSPDNPNNDGRDIFGRQYKATTSDEKNGSK
jgi:hypothetical protein